MCKGYYHHYHHLHQWPLQCPYVIPWGDSSPHTPSFNHPKLRCYCCPNFTNEGPRCTKCEVLCSQLNNRSVLTTQVSPRPVFTPIQTLWSAMLTLQTSWAHGQGKPLQEYEGNCMALKRLHLSVLTWMWVGCVWQDQGSVKIIFIRKAL